MGEERRQGVRNNDTVCQPPIDNRQFLKPNLT
jgi:hypothetical protein